MLKRKTSKRLTWLRRLLIIRIGYDFISQLPVESAAWKLRAYKGEVKKTQPTLFGPSATIEDVGIWSLNQNMYEFWISKEVRERRNNGLYLILGYIDRFEETQTHVWGTVEIPRRFLPAIFGIAIGVSIALIFGLSVVIWGCILVVLLFCLIFLTNSGNNTITHERIKFIHDLFDTDC